jgi:8-amino-7-oxononanoate synthase
LKQYAGHDAQIIIVSESVFSMDGDRADLAALIELSDQHDALLYIDEAHATGLFGPGGYGLTAKHKGRIDVVMGTFGKALGGFGAYIACGKDIRDYLMQACGGLIYSTALPPAVLGTIEAALDLLPEMEDVRRSLQEEASRLRAALQEQAWNCGASTTQIIPVIVGEEAAALELAAILEEKGFLISAIRPPTVAPNASRLRISISAAHKREDIDKLIAAMEMLASRFAVPLQAQAS